MSYKVAKDFRASARGALSGRWWPAIGTGALATLLGGASVPGVELNFSGKEETDITEFTEISDITDIINTVGLEKLMTVLGVTLIAMLVTAVISLILGSVVSIGYAKYNLDLYEAPEARCRTLFNYFRYWSTAICASLLSTVYIVIGFILLIIPGIIISFNYAMVPFVLADDPTISASEALARSRDLMKGNRWRYFCMNLSFIGWMILATVTVVGIFVITPYIYAAKAEFYREITGLRKTYDPYASAYGDAPVDYPSDIYTDQ